ncbi:MAG: hypothetical protein ACLP9L_25785 [Thermoguttaceae bacterium]
MGSILDKKFTKIWQSLKNNAGVKSSPWFKKADAAVSTKVEAYQEALLKAQSGLVEDLLNLGNALRDLEDAFVKFVDAKGLGQVDDTDMKVAAKATLVAEINRYKAKVQHERTFFDSRLKSALAAADNDLKKLESIEASKKKELWKGFGIDL